MAVLALRPVADAHLRKAAEHAAFCASPPPSALKREAPGRASRLAFVLSKPWASSARSQRGGVGSGERGAPIKTGACFCAKRGLVARTKGWAVAMKIAVLGNGVCRAGRGAGFADFGNEVVCSDIDGSRIAALSRGELPIYEPGLPELLCEPTSVRGGCASAMRPRASFPGPRSS